MMRAAIYARKSTLQRAAAEELSIAVQVENARRFAAAHAWSIAEQHIYSDDGISGAEFAGRPGVMRLMAAVARREFDVLIMSEGSRLGREQIETSFLLKQALTSGVRVFNYRDGRELILNTPTDKLMLSISAFSDEVERDLARQRTHDAMLTKARQGHVTGGRLFGYRNVDVLGDADAAGNRARLYVVHEVNPEEAAIIRLIFDMAGDGQGLRTIAKRLNDDGVLAPRSQRGRPRGWVGSSILPMLARDQYRGEATYNKTQKRDQWGRKNQRPRPESEWLRIPAPHLRIVTDEQWARVQERRAALRATFGRSPTGRLDGRRAVGGTSKYLLPGLARCGVCNGTMHVRSRSHGRRRGHFYGCSAYHERGTKICANSLEVRMEMADSAILETFEAVIVSPAVVARTMELVRTRLERASPTASAARETLMEEAKEIAARLGRLVEFVATGVDSPTVAAQIQSLERRRSAVETQITKLTVPVRSLSGADMDAAIRKRITDWRGLLAGNTTAARLLLKKLLVGPLVFRPSTDRYRFEGTAHLGELVEIGGALSVASPTGFEPVF